MEAIGLDEMRRAVEHRNYVGILEALTWMHGVHCEKEKPRVNELMDFVDANNVLDLLGDIDSRFIR